MTTAASVKPLTPQEWETLIDDYNHGVDSRLHRWISADYAGPTLADLGLSSLLRKDFSLHLKLHLLIFLEEHAAWIFAPSPGSSLPRLLETLRHVIQSPNPNPNDAVAASLYLKEQFLVSATAVFIACCPDGGCGGGPPPHSETLEGLVELLLTIANRSNHGVDRQTRAIACECLRELEMAVPCLLSEVGAHIWGLCQSERTHAAQSYVLLLAAVVYNIVHRRPPQAANVSVLSSSVPLVPFNIPRFLLDADVDAGAVDCERNFEVGSYKELRRVISFLLEWPQFLTPGGLLEFMRMTMPVAKALELQAPLLKVQFSGLMYTYDPLLCHAYIGMYLVFLDSFDGQELEIADRLVLQSKECSQNHVVFRLLSVWLLGLIRLVVDRAVRKKKSFVDRSLSFYPAIFDPMALKSLKLDLAACCSVLVNDLGSLKKNIHGAANAE